MNKAQQEAIDEALVNLRRGLKHREEECLECGQNLIKAEKELKSAQERHEQVLTRIANLQERGNIRQNQQRGQNGNKN